MDHVFPRSLYVQLPQQALTVPACGACQAATSPDEDYLRGFIASTSYRHDTARELWPRIRRSLLRDRRAQAAFMNSLRKVDVHSAGGLYLGTVDGLEADATRINRALGKIVRGLWCAETSGNVMPADQLTWAFASATPLGPRLPEKTADAICKLPLRRAGREVDYRFALMGGDRLTTLSWMDFYGCIMFAVSTRPASTADDGAADEKPGP